MKDEIKKNYCLEIDEIIKNEDSTDGNVYMLTSPSNKYIMKLYDEENHAISMVKIHKDLKNGGMIFTHVIILKLFIMNTH